MRFLPVRSLTIIFFCFVLFFCLFCSGGYLDCGEGMMFSRDFEIENPTLYATGHDEELTPERLHGITSLGALKYNVAKPFEWPSGRVVFLVIPFPLLFFFLLFFVFFKLLMSNRPPRPIYKISRRQVCRRRQVAPRVHARDQRCDRQGQHQHAFHDRDQVHLDDQGQHVSRLQAHFWLRQLQGRVRGRQGPG
jgi:hypothetical protein